MGFFKKKGKGKMLRQEAAGQIFIVLGFFAAALTQEVVAIVRKIVESKGDLAYDIYSWVIILGWGGLIFMILKMIDRLYEE